MNWATQYSLVIYDLGATGGTKPVFAQFKDEAGNQSQNYSDTIVSVLGLPMTRRP